ncbi:ESX secretion-associated protein EspG [Nocardia stercoris]|uniref:ESX secretion-associated protein EspG n=1 Tax=Nocardia stercoris TaxID=2483361 RepID=A0A3M2L5S4_9NOCA|nr:ESX secretion-associated protein EspG [Nocardia stercoris]RMI29898.1 hypothetical protein EBN03_24200 [Nocardia stercoris]
MTLTSWTFTPDEFVHVWSTETGLVGDYPHPINLIESPLTTSEYDRLQADLAVRYPPHADRDLTMSLQVLANPELRIVCNGWSHITEERVRSCAVASGDLGVVVHQKPGAAVEFGGDLRVVVTQRRRIGRLMAATMPIAAPGAAGPLHGYTPRVRGEESPTSWLQDDFGDGPVEERIRDLLRAPRGLDGYLRIERGIHQGHPASREFLSWIDVLDPASAAGRYLIEVANDDTIVSPASTQAIADVLCRRADLE